MNSHCTTSLPRVLNSFWRSVPAFVVQMSICSHTIAIAALNSGCSNDNKIQRESNYLHDLAMAFAAMDCTSACDLVREHKSITNSVLPNGNTVLIESIQRGCINVAEVLINRGANVDMKNKHGVSALAAALLNEQFEIAFILIDAGACVYHVNETGMSAMHLAAAAGGREIVSALIKRGMCPNVRDCLDGTPLHLARDNGIAIELLKAGASVEEPWMLHTPLYSAVLRADRELVQLLLDWGADPHTQSAHGDTAVELANRLGHYDIATILLER